MIFQWKTHVLELDRCFVQAAALVRGGDDEHTHVLRARGLNRRVGAAGGASTRRREGADKLVVQVLQKFTRAIRAQQCPWINTSSTRKLPLL